MPTGIYKHPKQCGFQNGHPQLKNKTSFQKGHKGFWSGKKLLEEHKLKIKLKNTGKIRTEKFKKRLSDIKKGVKLTEKHKINLSLSHTGYVMPTEQKIKIKEALLKTILNKGKNNHNWKGGITPENKRIRASIEYRQWREEVFKRDDWTCQECKLRSGKLHPHHKKQFAFYPKLRFIVDNGITLCENCHNKKHRKSSYR